MAYPDELLQLAAELASPRVPEPRQASLRRSISTSYYALFHLLIEQATANWAYKQFRTELGRIFEHGKMKAACVEVRQSLVAAGKRGPLPETGSHLLLVADAFIVLQDERHLADYDNGRT